MRLQHIKNKADAATKTGLRLWAAALVCGIIFSAGFAPFYAWPAALLALGLLYRQQRTAPSLRPALYGAAGFALGHTLSAYYWLPQAFVVKSGNFWLGWAVGIPALLILAAVLGSFIVAACLLFQLIKRRLPSATWPVAFTLCWVGLEGIRSFWPFTGFPWNLTGYIWADTPLLLQTAAVWKIWLISAVVVLCAALLLHSRRSWLLSVCLLAANALYGWGITTHAHSAPPATASTNTLHLALVQPNIAQPTQWNRSNSLEAVRKMMSLTQADPHMAEADIIVWPESSVFFFIEEEPYMRLWLAEALRPGQILLAGTLRREETDGASRYFNTVLGINHHGDIVFRYDKRLPVPFGEYIPLRSAMPWFVTRFINHTADYSFGAVQQHTVLHGTPLQMLICYESIFPQLIKRHGGLLLNLTNDAWYDGTTAPYQHFAMARVRAVEARQPLIRLGNTGITAHLDAYGRTVERLPARTEGIMHVRIVKPDIKTP